VDTITFGVGVRKVSWPDAYGPATYLLAEGIERAEVQLSPTPDPMREIKSIMEEYELLKPPVGGFERVHIQ
jgi:hypothetical protein